MRARPAGSQVQARGQARDAACWAGLLRPCAVKKNMLKVAPNCENLIIFDSMWFHVCIWELVQTSLVWPSAFRAGKPGQSPLGDTVFGWIHWRESRRKGARVVNWGSAGLGVEEISEEWRHADSHTVQLMFFGMFEPHLAHAQMMASYGIYVTRLRTAWIGNIGQSCQGKCVYIYIYIVYIVYIDIYRPSVASGACAQIKGDDWTIWYWTDMCVTIFSRDF